MNAVTCWGKNTIGRTAAVLKSPIRRPLPLPSPYIVLDGFCPWVRSGCIACSTSRGGFQCGEDVYPSIHTCCMMMCSLKGKRSLYGAFQHCGRSAYCILNPNKFPHSSPKAPHIIQTRETSTSEGRNYYQLILLANP